MTLPATSRRAGPFSGNGSTTVFPFTFKVFASSEIAVYKTSIVGVDTVLTLNSHYSVALNGDQTANPGGNITYPISGSPLATGEKLTAIGALPYDQTLDIPDGGNYAPLAHENALDRIEMQIQQLAENVARTMVLPVSSSNAPVLPTGVPYDLIGWDATGTTLVNYSPGAFSASTVNVYQANQSVLPVALTSTAGSVAVNAALSNNFTHTLTENTTLANPTNLTNGMILNFRFKNHASAPKTMALGSKYKLAGGAAMALTATNGAVDFMSCYYDLASDTLNCVVNKAFA